MKKLLISTLVIGILLSCITVGANTNSVKTLEAIQGCQNDDIVTWNSGLFVCKRWYSILPSKSLIPFTGIATCPTGTARASALDGRFLVGASTSIGTNTGNSSVTPTFTGTAQTFTNTVGITLLGAGQAMASPNPYSPTGTISAVNLKPPSVETLWCEIP